MTDFTPELALIEQTEQRRKAELARTPADTPSSCDCGRSHNEHLEEDIAACDVLRQLLVNGNLDLLMEKWLAFGEEYLSYAVTNLYRELHPVEYSVRTMETLAKLWKRFGMALKDFAPYNHALPPTPLM